MKKLTKAAFDELTAKLNNYLKNVKPSALENGVSLEDALGKEDADAYNQYLINEAYQQHGVLPRVS